jgi:hypothetical protein
MVDMCGDGGDVTWPFRRYCIRTRDSARRRSSQTVRDRVQVHYQRLFLGRVVNLPRRLT